MLAYAACLQVGFGKNMSGLVYIFGGSYDGAASLVVVLSFSDLVG
jgi:hypothetical protein